MMFTILLLISFILALIITYTSTSTSVDTRTYYYFILAGMILAAIAMILTIMLIEGFIS